MVIKMQFGKRILLLLCAVLMLFSMFPAIRSGASTGPSLVTTLTDNAVQRGSKKNFDVWARNAGGEKIRATVTHNGRAAANLLRRCEFCTRERQRQKVRKNPEEPFIDWVLPDFLLVSPRLSGFMKKSIVRLIGKIARFHLVKILFVWYPNNE